MVRSSGQAVNGILANSIQQLGEYPQTFNLYSKVVNPADGMIYWVITETKKTFTVVRHQSEQANPEVDRFVKTGEYLVSSTMDMDEIADGIWISADKTIAINAREYLTRIAGEYHYRGANITADFLQFLAPPTEIVITNSIPIFIQSGMFDIPAYGQMTSPLGETTPFCTIEVSSSKTSVPMPRNGNFMAQDSLVIWVQNANINIATKMLYDLREKTQFFAYGLVGAFPTMTFEPRVHESLSIQNARIKIEATVSYSIKASISAAVQMIRSLSLPFTVGEYQMQIGASV